MFSRRDYELVMKGKREEARVKSKLLTIDLRGTVVATETHAMSILPAVKSKLMVWGVESSTRNQIEIAGLPRRTYFWTLPVAVFGSSDTTIEDKGNASAIAR